MKKNLSKSLSGTTLLLALALSACGGDETPGNLAAYQQGSNKCSDQFLQEGQQLEVDVEMDLISFNDEAAHQAINQFGAKYKDVNCKVEVDGQSQMIDVNDFVSRANAELAQFREQHPYSPTNSAGPSFPSAPTEVPSYPAPAPSSARFENGSELVKNGITLQVNDPSVFSPANWQYTGPMYIQNGHPINEFGVNEDIDGCEIRYYHQGPDLHAGSKLHLEIDDSNPLLVQFHPADSSFTLTCHHDGVFNLSSFTLDDLNRVLGSLATASVSK